VLAAVAITLLGLALKIAGGRAGRHMAVYRPQEAQDSRKIPYGPAIFVGTCLAALGAVIWRA
jgi:hypothetical protein